MPENEEQNTEPVITNVADSFPKIIGDDIIKGGVHKMVDPPPPPPKDSK